MPIFSVTDLTDFTCSLIVAAGAPDDIAQYVAHTLVTANLMGHDSHGVIRLKYYMAQIQKGTLLPAARPEIVKQTGATAQVSDRQGFGQTAARLSAQVARDLAREHGIGCVSLQAVNHIGRLGEYAGWLAGEGLVGIVMTGIAGRGTTPYGGREAIFGTNPMAWAAPTGDGPLVLDFATSMVAAGKLMVALDEGKAAPSGWIQDSDGQPTTNPQDLFDGGMLLPFGTYKGYGLNLMVAIIPILLAGFTPIPGPDTISGNATLIIALSIEAFTSPDRFTRLADELRQRVKSVEPAAGFDEVLLPGDKEARSMAQRQRDGIPIPDKTWAKLVEMAGEWDMPVPEA